jgi:uncharacterized membrane protein
MTDDNDPIKNRENFKAGLFYYNPDDDRVLIRVPGTVNRYVANYARFQVYLIIVPLLLMVLYAIFFYKP